MGELHVQRYLRNAGKLDEGALLAYFAIKVKRHQRFPNLCLFKYSQIDSPMGLPMVQECRGLILDEADDWRVVSRSFSKFFNHGEGHAAEIDWTTATVQEKLDGSLCVLYHYAGEWHVQTTGTPDAGGPVYGLPRTFADLFWEAWDTETNGGGLPGPHAEGYSFYFELTSPFNRIVVPHAETRLRLLGARHLESDAELSQEEASALLGDVFELPKKFWLGSWDGIKETFARLSPLETEGYVVCDGNFNRVKVKHPGYVSLHHAKDGASFKNLVEVARSGEASELESAFPELKAQLDEIRGRLDLLVARTEGAYSAIQHVEAQKDFALCATRTGVGAALFAVRAKKAPSFRSFYAGIRLEMLMELLGYRDVVEEVKEAA